MWKDSTFWNTSFTLFYYWTMRYISQCRIERWRLFDRMLSRKSLLGGSGQELLRNWPETSRWPKFLASYWLDRGRSLHLGPSFRLALRRDAVGTLTGNDRGKKINFPRWRSGENFGATQPRERSSTREPLARNGFLLRASVRRSLPLSAR